MAEKNVQVGIANELGLDAWMIEEDERQKEIWESVKHYQRPKTPELQEQLEWFMDQKFGLMIHWGLYNQMGMKESWPLVDAYEWTRWQFPPETTPEEIKEMYSRLHKGFLPLRFNPKEWADVAYDAGFRYLCFTTKHHDGFCLWDTKTSNYKVTGSDVPWKDHKYADITKHLFDAFRKKGMGISAYYSRADFSCPYYWEEGYGAKRGAKRVPSYSPKEKPEKWKKFQEYVFAQLKELVTDYGKIDCLWYDGGCSGRELGLPEMTEELRKIQPHMLGVIRGGSGVCEDIFTPELVRPNKYLPVPWEECEVMGKKMYENGGEGVSFGYTYDQDYMSTKEIAHALLDIVAKGGNLALNLAPQPDGRLPGRALKKLKVLGEWMKTFSGAIYSTRAVSPYRTEQYAYTRSKDGKIVNVFYLYDEEECIRSEYTFALEGTAEKVEDVRSGKDLHFVQDGNHITVYLPAEISGRQGDIADCFRVALA